MPGYASNCPISRPAVLNVAADYDLNGVGWSDDLGLFYPVSQVSADADLFVVPVQSGIS